ncbi:response regulator [Galactobacter valiniphilus]|uniref:Transcriptional regulatory protein n=1 Tax=Galactobacter valiniphilus TaxID=2676122 RepID=A0A399J6W0_9MICC|nr:response regulator [Galactobacter valiniphilus]RII41201.1 response regulator [Galactobacter valiniphilus]
MINVVVVDDDFMVARIHAGFVANEEGFHVAGVAHNAHEATSLVASTRPHLVLLDIHLPDTNGLDLLRELRGIHPDLDALVITAAREQATVGRAVRGGVVGYLMKPFAREDLAVRLQNYRQLVSAVGGEGTAEQATIDRFFGAPPAAAGAPAPPKGLSGETLAKVREAVASAAGDLSASEAAQRVGISRVSARRYLEHLAAQGVLSVELKYGAGRPERRYRAHA